VIRKPSTRGGYSHGRGLQNTNPQWVVAPVEKKKKERKKGSLLASLQDAYDTKVATPISLSYTIIIIVWLMDPVTSRTNEALSQLFNLQTRLQWKQSETQSRK